MGASTRFKGIVVSIGVYIEGLECQESIVFVYRWLCLLVRSIAPHELQFRMDPGPTEL